MANEKRGSILICNLFFTRKIRLMFSQLQYQDYCSKNLSSKEFDEDTKIGMPGALTFDCSHQCFKSCLL